MEAILKRVIPYIYQQFYQPKAIVIPALLLMLCFVTVLSVGIGAVQVLPLDVLRILAYKMRLSTELNVPDYIISVLVNIRIPRVFLGIMVGACLGICGSALQGLFRNPLADPALIGVSSGAAVAAVAMTFYGSLMISLFNNYMFLLFMPIAAFLGGAITTLTVYLLATKEQRTDMATMLLAGIAVNAIASAGIGIFVYIGDDQQVRMILFWMFGSLGGAMWDTLIPSLPFLLVSIIGISFFGYSLNLYLLGESEARHLGLNVQQLKWIVIALVALGVGSSVALSGMIGFVGLVVPHLLRLIAGPDNRLLLPSSALLGAVLLLTADLIARTIVSPVELPIGLVTSLLGAPFFLYLLIHNRRNVRI